MVDGSQPQVLPHSQRAAAVPTACRSRWFGIDRPSSRLLRRDWPRGQFGPCQQSLAQFGASTNGLMVYRHHLQRRNHGRPDHRFRSNGTLNTDPLAPDGGPVQASRRWPRLAALRSTSCRGRLALIWVAQSCGQSCADTDRPASASDPRHLRRRPSQYRRPLPVRAATGSVTIPRGNGRLNWTSRSAPAAALPTTRLFLGLTGHMVNSTRVSCAGGRSRPVLTTSRSFMGGAAAGGLSWSRE